MAVVDTFVSCVFPYSQIAELKAWVTDSNVEDDDFFKMSQASKTKKADWVAYVKRKLQGLA
jgi:hypothetical protein